LNGSLSISLSLAFSRLFSRFKGLNDTFHMNVLLLKKIAAFNKHSNPTNHPKPPTTFTQATQKPHTTLTFMGIVLPFPLARSTLVAVNIDYGSSMVWWDFLSIYLCEACVWLGKREEREERGGEGRVRVRDGVTVGVISVCGVFFLVF
jgi:hypothetical protein